MPRGDFLFKSVFLSVSGFEITHLPLQRSQLFVIDVFLCGSVRGHTDIGCGEKAEVVQVL